MNLDYKTVLAIGAVLGIGAYLARRQVVQTAQAVGSAINPVSSENIFYKGASAVTNAIANDTQEVPLGTRIYDFFNTGQ